MFRIDGAGVPQLLSDGTNGERGDQLVNIHVGESTGVIIEESNNLFHKLSEAFRQFLQKQKK
jgi:hypothetical protein